MGRFLGVAAALISIGAGIYLLTSESASAQTTVFDILMHGIGAYFVARGCWMLYELRQVASAFVADAPLERQTKPF